MRTLYRNDDYQLVDNEHDYDFVGWMENFTDATLVLIFELGDTEDTEDDELVWKEDEWEVHLTTLCYKQQTIEEWREYVKENYLEIVEIEPHKWGGFAADNVGRSMFNALKKYLVK